MNDSRDICEDIYYEIITFLNLNDIRQLLTTSSDISKIAQDSRHYMECKGYGKVEIKKLFERIITEGNLYVCKYVFRFAQISVDTLNSSFIIACSIGYLDIANWLINIKQSNKNVVDLHFGNDLAFACSCEHGHLHIAQWLISLSDKINIHADNEYAFRWTCSKGHLEIAQWLIELAKKYGLT